MWLKLDFLPWDRSQRKVILNLQRSISASPHRRWAMTMHKKKFNTNYIVYTNMGNATINEHINGKTTKAKEGTNTMRAHTIIKWQVNDKEGWFSCCHRISIAHIQFQIWFNLTLLLVTFFNPFGVKMLRWTRLAVKFIQFGLTTIGCDVMLCHIHHCDEIIVFIRLNIRYYMPWPRSHSIRSQYIDLDKIDDSLIYKFKNPV